MKKHKKIKLENKLLRRHKVGAIFLFGSQVSGITHPGSDIDIGVVFQDEQVRFKKPLEVYGDLYEVFCKAFKTTNLDIVYLRETPYSLQFRAIQQGKVLYQSSPKFLADYKEEAFIKYFDFKPVEDYLERVFLGLPA